MQLPEARFYSDAVPEKWDDIEIHGIWDDGEGNAEPTDNDEDISYHSLFLHDVEGGVLCIADFPTEAAALVFKDLLTKSVLNYTENGYLKL